MAISPDACGQLALRFEVLSPHLNERQRRLLLGAEARLLGHGGVRAVAQVAGVSEQMAARRSAAAQTREGIVTSCRPNLCGSVTSLARIAASAGRLPLRIRPDELFGPRFALLAACRPGRRREY